MPKITPLRNPYKLQPVKREEEEPVEVFKPKGPQPFKVGDTLRCRHLPMHYTIPEPCKAVKVEATKRCVSTWMITVLDTEGKERELDSSHFNLHQA